MKISRKSLITTMVAGLLIFLIVGVSVAGKNGGGKSTENNGKLTNEQIEEFQQQGYSMEDIYTAQSISRKINISAADLLKEKKGGLSWPEIIEKLAPGVVLKREDDTGKEPPKMDKKKVKELQEKGYGINDIAEAFTLAWRYDKTIDETLEYKKGKKDWQEVDSDFAAVKVDKEGKGKVRKITFLGEEDKGKEDKSPDGLSADEVNLYVQQGYDPKDVLRADALARKFGKTIEEVLNMNKTASNWGEVVSQLAKESAEVGENGKPKLTEFNYSDRVEGEVSGDTSKSGLSLDQINRLLEQYPAEDVFAADSLAAKYGFDVEKALSLKQSGKNWREIIVENTSFDISMSLEDVVKRYNLDARYVKSLLDNNGLKLRDIMTAGEISEGSKKPFQEVIQIRLSSSNWMDVFEKMGLKVKEIPSSQGGAAR